jgi:hypothetical protein
MDIVELEAELSAVLRAFYITSKKQTLLRDASFCLEVPEFGVVVAGFSPEDYTFVNSALQARYRNWRHVLIATSANINEARETILWDLMRGGYIRNIRNRFPNQFKNLLIMGDFGSKIIRKRLEVWNNKPMFRSLIDENTMALRMSTTMVLSADETFFDCMPEEVK